MVFLSYVGLTDKNTRQKIVCKPTSLTGDGTITIEGLARTKTGLTQPALPWLGPSVQGADKVIAMKKELIGRQSIDYLPVGR